MPISCQFRPFSFRHQRAGFTLIELSVVITIMAVMTLVILANLPNMGTTLSLDAIAQELAIDIRSAQVYSRSTRVVTNIKPTTPFAIQFDKANAAEFTLFAQTKTEADGVTPLVTYQADGDDNQYAERYQLQGGYTIAKILYQNNSDFIPVSSYPFVISFVRPGTVAKFYSDQTELMTPAIAICIGGGRNNRYKLVRVRVNGGIEVDNPSSNECQD